jgi:hypothetical protein
MKPNNNIDIRYTGISGIYTPLATTKTIYLGYSAMSSNDTDQSIINIAAITTQTSGTLNTRSNRTSASDAAIASLNAKSWTITYSG